MFATYDMGPVGIELALTSQPAHPTNDPQKIKKLVKPKCLNTIPRNDYNGRIIKGEHAGFVP